MKLPHVVILSSIGMVATSLSVYVFTSPREASPDDLTSNELELGVVHSASPTRSLSLVLEPDTTASITTPRTNSTGQTAPSAENGETFGLLQLTAVDEPCSFSIDGKPVQVENNVPLTVRIGPHKVKCERPNGDVIETQIEVVEEAINPVGF